MSVSEWALFNSAKTSANDAIVAHGIELINTTVFNSATFDRAIRHGLQYLEKMQRPDGSWLPLWFGNQYEEDEANPIYGTARVLTAYRDLCLMDSRPARRGIEWLMAQQNSDGGFGGDLT